VEKRLWAYVEAKRQLTPAVICDAAHCVKCKQTHCFKWLLFQSRIAVGY